MNDHDATLRLVRTALRRVKHREVRMFGGTAFMVREHMLVAVSPRGLLVRVGPAAHDEALRKPGTQAMEMRGRMMRGYVLVDPAPTDAKTVQVWLEGALAHNKGLPAKTAASRSRAKSKTQRTKSRKKARP
jgi:TfoX/Sxy family transcriptional regulator of competence genes